MATVNPYQYFQVEGNDNYYMRTGSGITQVDRLPGADFLPGEVGNIITTPLSTQDVEATWRDILNAGSNRYDLFKNAVTGQNLKQSDIEGYLGVAPAGTMATRSQELSGNTTGLSTGSALSGSPVQMVQGTAGATQDYSNFQGLKYDDLVAAQTQNGGTAENPYRGAMPQAPQMPQVPTQNVSINPSITTGSSTMGGGSTNLDVQSALQKNMKFREQLIQSMMPTAQETALQQQMASLNDQARGTQLSAQAGILNTSNKLVPMQAIIGEQRNIVEQANLKLQTIAAQQDAVTGQLQIAQTKRTALQNILKLQLEFGQQDLEMAQDAASLAKEYADEVKAEQKEAKAVALEMGITKQFYDVGGTIYRTSDGKAYSTPEAFFADGGAQDWSNVEKIEPPQAERDTQVVTANGRTLLIDKNTGETIQDLGGAYKTGSGGSGGSSGGSRSGGTSVKSSMDTAGEVKAWILANKRANTDMPYYDLWGQLADQLRAEGLNPDNYNKVFWEVLHPEGTAGYTKYVTSSGREL